MWLRALALAAWTLATASCGGEDPVATLEKQKQELLASTVEKKEFWALVERKGALAKRQKELDQERDSYRAELPVTDARRAAVEPALAEARDVNSRAEGVKAEVERRQAELDAALRELEAKLASWKSAGAPGGPG